MTVNCVRELDGNGRTFTPRTFPEPALEAHQGKKRSGRFPER